MPDLGCWGGEIVPKDKDGYVPKSVLLKCRCGLRGYITKNIGYIGARTIFSHPTGGCDWMREQTAHWRTRGECPCPGSHLSVDKELMEHVKNCPACRKYGL